MRADSNIIDFEKFKLKVCLEKNGFQWHEDNAGKVRIWIRRMKKPASPSGNFPFQGENKH